MLLCHRVNTIAIELYLDKKLSSGSEIKSREQVLVRPESSHKDVRCKVTCACAFADCRAILEPAHKQQQRRGMRAKVTFDAPEMNSGYAQAWQTAGEMKGDN